MNIKNYVLHQMQHFGPSLSSMGQIGTEFRIVTADNGLHIFHSISWITQCPATDRHTNRFQKGASLLLRKINQFDQQTAINASKATGNTFHDAKSKQNGDLRICPLNANEGTPPLCNHCHRIHSTTNFSPAQLIMWNCWKYAQTVNEQSLLDSQTFPQFRITF